MSLKRVESVYYNNLRKPAENIMVPRRGLEPPRLAALAPEADDNSYKSTPLSTILTNYALGILRATGRELKVCALVKGA